jgi:predicted ATPase
MKIAFIGSHGVGKTTLCFELAAALKRLDLSVDVVKEVARACPLPINQATTIPAQSWILHTQIAREIEAAPHYDAIVCDRAVVDNYAYLVHAAGRQDALEAMLCDWLRGYSLLVKVPIIAPPAYDGTRDTSAGFQVAIDRIIDLLLNDFGLERLVLPADDRSTWIRLVLEALSLPRQAPQLKLFE